MHRKQLTPRFLQHSRVRNRVFNAWKHTDLAGDGNGGGSGKSGDDRAHEGEVVHQEGAVVAALGDGLGATETERRIQSKSISNETSDKGGRKASQSILSQPSRRRDYGGKSTLGKSIEKEP